MALVKNIRTGKVANVPEHYLNHPSLGKDLVLVADKATEIAPEKSPKPKKFTFKAEEEAPAEATEGQFAPETDKENDEE
jgi:hypothetical protein